MNLSDLNNPFPASIISWRVGATSNGKGLALAYIDARDVQRRLDDVCGKGGWQCRHEASTGTKITCHIGINIDGEWIWKSNGAGETAVEADKGAYSDAFKRAAVMWGVGEYLYHINSPWVEMDGRKIKDSEMPKLHKILGGEFYAPVGVTELIKAARALSLDIEACDDTDQLTALVASKEATAIIDQLKTDQPGWWHGSGKDDNAPGLKFRIEKQQAELEAKEAA
jgi:hypothetical protein